MKPSSLKSLLVSRFNAGMKRPVLVESAPGIGKTQIAAQVALELGVEFKTIHAPLLLPEDYGLPSISKDKSSVDFIVSRDKFPLETSDCADRGILLIDELSQADSSAQKILANLIQEREIHGKRLKKDWTIIATGNRLSDRAGANRILGHLANRLTRVEVEVSLDDWTQWALNNGVKPEVISFIRFRPELLSSYDASQDTSATPRAWSEGVSPSLGAIESALEFEVFRGDVGEGPASEFLAFLKIFRKLPNPDAVLLNPTKIDVPTDPATLYALCGALAHRVTGANFDRAMTYVGRMPPEFSVLFVRDASARCSDIFTTKAYISWASGAGASLLT